MKATMKEIAIQLTQAQIKLVFEGLAERPFKQVFELIGQLNAQASAAFSDETSAEALGQFCFSADQLRLTIEVLGELPFNRVNLLLKSMHQQMREALHADH
jgi:hypothetical protein